MSDDAFLKSVARALDLMARANEKGDFALFLSVKPSQPILGICILLCERVLGTTHPFRLTQFEMSEALLAAASLALDGVE